MKIEITGLQPHEDAYGNNIYNTYHELDSGYDIIEREDGHFTLNGDSNAYTESYENWSEIQKQAATLIKGKTLDIGCGGGKHALHFQNNGIDLWGMDNSPLGLKVCEERGLKNTLLCDVNNLSVEVISELETIYLWGNNLGLLQNENLARRFFFNCDKMCSSNAKILVETLDPYGKAFFMEDDKKYIAENRTNGRLGGQIRVRVRYRHFVTPWRDYLFVSKNELDEILSPTPWKVTSYLDDTTIDQYIAVIERK
jgi:SAM-dependent methyltransferase